MTENNNLLINLSSLIPLAGFSISNNKIIHFVENLKPVILHSDVIKFILNLKQQDLKMELLFYWWENFRKNINEIIETDPLICLHVTENILNFSHIKITNVETPKFEDLCEILVLLIENQTENFIKNQARLVLREKNLQRYNIYLNGQEDDLLCLDTFPQENENIFNIENNRRFEERKIVKTIYNDSQNVHNSEINNSVIKSAEKLIQKTVSEICFQNGVKMNVFLEDNIETIHSKLASRCGVFSDQIIILTGENKKLDDLNNIVYPLRYQINQIDGNKFIFKKKEIKKYNSVIGIECFLFPEKIKRTGNLGKRLEKIFIATNKFFNSKNLEYLEVSGIKNAKYYWDNRILIVNNLQKIMSFEFDQFSKYETDEMDCFIDKVFLKLFNENFEKKDFKKHLKMSNVRNISISVLLNAVWKFSHLNIQNKEELLKRLKEELTDSFDVCCTGIVARLMSVIQGFTDDEDLFIKISEKEQVKNRMIFEIEKSIIIEKIDPIVDFQLFDHFLQEWFLNNYKTILEENEEIDFLDLKRIIFTTYNVEISIEQS
jgi:hypothetical protein